MWGLAMCDAWMRNLDGTVLHGKLSNTEQGNQLEGPNEPQPTFTQQPPIGNPLLTILTDAASGAAAIAAAKAAEPPPVDMVRLNMDDLQDEPIITSRPY